MCSASSLCAQRPLYVPSVEPGEVYQLKNRMDDNWAWGTSQKTGKSGIIPLIIMEEVAGVNPWYYGKPWFSADISRDRAIELLKASRYRGSISTSTSICTVLHTRPSGALDKEKTLVSSSTALTRF